jgi:uncharacterized damage-inducible protein DinB
MPDAPDQRLLEALLDSWDRNNTILLNLLRALPEGALEVRAVEGSPSIAELFTHIHYVRLVFVFEDAPEFARDVPKEEWVAKRNPGRLAQMLNDSAKAVRDAVKGRAEAGRDMNLHYDHPILLLQHMLWHEGYHHGQIKLALKLAGRPLSDKEAGPVTWGVWMRKMRIPAKANADSEGNANGIPGRRRTVLGAKRRWHFDCAGSVRLRQEKPIRSAAEEGPLAEKGVRGKGR